MTSSDAISSETPIVSAALARGEELTAAKETLYTQEERIELADRSRVRKVYIVVRRLMDAISQCRIISSTIPHIFQSHSVVNISKAWIITHMGTRG